MPIQAWLACALILFSLSSSGLAGAQETPSVRAADLAIGIQEFEAADAALNAAYQRARALLPEELFIELRASQRIWLESRDVRAGYLASYLQGISTVDTPKDDSPDFWHARAVLTRGQADYLLGWVRAFDGSFAAENPWEGIWVDGNGGRLQILEVDDGALVFDLEVVRGPTLHLGQIAGPGTTDGTTALFQQQVPNEAELAEILMTRQGAIVVLESRGPINYFHGARAYFDGSYSRLQELSPTERQQLLEIGGF